LKVGIRTYSKPSTKRCRLELNTQQKTGKKLIKAGIKLDERGYSIIEEK
jgi:hypothetical protein